MHHGHMHKGNKKSYQVCTDHSNHALRTFQHPLLALSLMAQGGFSVIQDLAGRKPRALTRVSAALLAPYEECSDVMPPDCSMRTCH